MSKDTKEARGNQQEKIESKQTSYNVIIKLKIDVLDEDRLKRNGLLPPTFSILDLLDLEMNGMIEVCHINGAIISESEIQIK